MTATTIKGASKVGDKAEYYDKDGNATSENALGSYFSVDSSQKVVGKADAQRLFDAVGNEVAGSFPPSVPHLVQFRTVWSIPSIT